MAELVRDGAVVMAGGGGAGRQERRPFFGTFRSGEVAASDGTIASMRALVSILLCLSLSLPLPSEAAGQPFQGANALK